MELKGQTCMDLDFLIYSSVGGFSSSLGSLFGKLSRTLEGSWLTTGSLFVLMITFNTIGMMNFAKSLNLSTSSLKSILVTSATNYVSTAIIGSLLLGEETPFLWWCGTTLIISGLFIICYQQMKISKKAN